MSRRDGLLVLVLLIPAVVWPQVAGHLEILVLDEYRGYGVRSKIFGIKPNGEEVWMGETEPSGVLRLDSPCPAGYRVKARPFDVAYYTGRLASCSPNDTRLELFVAAKDAPIGVTSGARPGTGNGPATVIPAVLRQSRT